MFAWIWSIIRRVFSPPYVEEIDTVLERFATTTLNLSQNTPERWGNHLQSIAKDIKAINRWLEGDHRHALSSAMERDQYLAKLWDAIGLLRMKGCYTEAVRLWSLTRLSTSVKNKEVVLLAGAMANALSTQYLYPNDFDLSLARQALLLSVEALYLGADAIALGGLFDGLLSMDRVQPEADRQVQLRMALIEMLLTSFKEQLPHGLRADLERWQEAGRR